MTPDLESFSLKTTKHTETYRIYEFEYPSVAGGVIIQGYIDSVMDNCKNYKLIIVGDHHGHLEIYESEDYTGNLNLVIVKGSTEVEKLWDE